MAFCRQFVLLLWKNWLLQSRKICVTVFEILLPICFAGLVLYTRSTSTVRVEHNSTVFRTDIIDGEVLNYYSTGGKDVLYAPNNPSITELMDRATRKLKKRGVLFTGVPFASEAELMNDFNSREKVDDVFMAVVFQGDFDGSSDLPERLTLKLRPVSSQYDSWHTGRVFDFSTGRGPGLYSQGKYYRSGFMAVQYAVTSAIIEQKNTTANVTNDVTLAVERMVYPPFSLDYFSSTFAIMGPLLIMVAMILSVLQITKDVVFEKERKLKESMKMMGLTNFTHWAAWFFKSFIVLAIIMVIFTILFSIPVGQYGLSVISASDKSLFFVFLLCYITATIAYCFLVSTCFNKANGAAAVSAILFIICYGPYFAFEGMFPYMTFSQKMASCLLFNVGMGFGFKIFATADQTGRGVHWFDASTRDFPDDLSISLVMIMLLLDAAIYLTITWYIDAVFPGEYGVPQPWYFPVTRTYWCGSKPKVNEDGPELSYYSGDADRGFFEKDPAGLTQGISVRNLRKEFKARGKAPVIAVNGTNLNVFKGQITALLGHNGAGKTTTMSMLTGFLPATSGTAFVNGYDVSRDISSVRKSLGLCPQHNILFDSLTVTEHLTFFALLKGFPKAEVMQEVADMIRVVGLAGKETAYSRTLSGGQKRKLSIGIALIGGSEVVILDEPTSGMDPQARTQIWRILQEHKANRTILFTTHFKDEADILGDRIAIMADGVVKCCGTPLFLKRKYGSGYQLTIVKGPQCDTQRISQLIKSHVTTAMEKSNVGSELTFSLPSSESHKFETLFKEMEHQSVDLGMTSFGASVTTMEEVFLRSGESTDSDQNQITSNGQSAQNVSTAEMLNGNFHQSTEFLVMNQEDNKNNGIALTAQQFRAGLTKKILHTWRNRVVTLAQLILPMAFTAAGLAVNNLSIPSPSGPEPPLTLDMAPFPDNIVAYGLRNQQTFEPDITELFVRQFENTASRLKYVDLKDYKNNLSSFYEVVGKAEGQVRYNRLYLIGAMFGKTELVTSETLNIKGYYNGQPYHSQGIVMAYMMNTLLKYYVNPSSEVTMVNHPLPEKRTTTYEQVSPSAFALTFFILFGMGFMTSCYAIFLIKERVSQAKQIQTVSGLRPVTFWLTHWIWDFVSYMLPCMGVLIVFAAFQTPEVAAHRMGYLFVILFFFGLAVIPHIYIFTFLFKTPPGGFVALVMLNFLTGFALLMVVFFIGLQPKAPVQQINALKWAFGAIFPNYCLGQTFMDFFDNYRAHKICNIQDYGNNISCEGGNPRFMNPCCTVQDYFAIPYPGVGRFVLMMALQGPMYFTLVLVIEYGVFRKLFYLLRNPPELPPDIRLVREDHDVAEERARINAVHPKAQTDSLVLYNITKFYGSHLAVNRLCLGVPQNECFGLLGVNGAGKTSTFKMLTGEEVISHGNAYVNSHDVQQNMQQVHQSIGYCPQFDALIDQMTGRETLTMYARLRGIPESRIPEIVRLLMKILWFDEHADKETRQYSGGTKRKLSTAIALIGDSPVIFLDEPTTGVDPVARRQLWNLLSQIRASGRTLILTSHSMEECDALCTRIAIMVNGQFLCLGSPQHLKNKFGQGYTFIARVASSNTEALERFIEQKFPRHQKMDSTIGYVSYQLLDPDLPLSYIFGSVETARHELHLEDYSVSQTTLHQVFLDFTKHQTPAHLTRQKRCCCCICCCACCNCC